MLEPNFKMTEITSMNLPVKRVEHVPREKPDLSTSDLPSWLSSKPTAEEQADDAFLKVRLQRHPRTREQLELEETVFSVFFERFLEAVAVNEKPKELINNDPRNIDPARFMRWIKKDAERTSRFVEAQEIASEFLVYDCDNIAEGLDTLEDIERSKLRLKQNEFKIKSWNKKRYGDTKQLDINMNASIDIHALLEQRDAQLLTLEGAYSVVEQNPSHSTVPHLVEHIG